MLSEVQIPPIRLAIALICTALAVVLLLFLFFRWLFRRIRYGRRYRGGGGYPYGAGILTRHSRPSSSSRRYGRGYRPYATQKRRKKVSRRKYGTFHYYGHTEAKETGNETHSEYD